LPSSGHRNGLIHISSIDWYKALTARQQQLTERIAKERKTLVVENMTDIVSALRRGRFFGRLSDNLWLLSPFKFIPFEAKSSAIKKLNRILLAGLVRRAARQAHIENPILYFSTYDDHELPSRVPHSLIVYDCYDLHEAFSWASGKEIELERRLLEEANLVTASSQNLVRKLGEKGIRAALVRNAADVEFFKTTRDPGDIYSGIKDVAFPRIGFMGLIADWVDLDLLDYVATSRPSWNLVLAGRRRVDDHPLFHRPNVTLLGTVPYRELPSLLRGFDVCVIPFKVGPLTDAADTIKLFEYLSAGKRVVSTAIEQAKGFSNLISVANSREEFLHEIEAVLSSPGLQLPKNLDDVLKQHDWDVRTQMLDQLLEDALKRKTDPTHHARLS
jgi:glycosyltransferase involved in cell wall biosynthesis